VGVRAAALTFLLLAAVTGVARADPPPGAQERFEHEKKSVGLAVTLEAISPIAGMGCFYGGENDKATVLALVSTGAMAAGVGGAVWLVHLEGESGGGFSGVTRNLEEGGAISLLVAAGVTYVITRISGLSLAPEATRAYNEDLRQRVGLPPSEFTIPFHAWAPLPGMSFTF
jgi:hypothetical protein